MDWAPLSVAARPVVAIDGRWTVRLIGSPDDVVVERDYLIATGMPAAELEAST